MSKSRLIVRDAAKFTISGYMASVCSFVGAIVVRRILSPFFMGVYSELLLIFEYAKYNHFGMIDSLDRQIPYYNGRKEYEKTEEIKNVAVSFSIFTSLICSLIIIFVSEFFKAQLLPPIAVGLKVIAVMILLQSLTSFYVTVVRTHHLFGSLSKYIILVAAFDIFFKIILGIKFGIMGILWATALSLIVGFIYLFKKTSLKFHIILKLPLDIVKSLLGIGFPMLLAGFAFMVLRSMDRIMIISLLSEEDLGYYSIAIMMHSLVFQFPNWMYTVLFPRFYEAFGSSENNIDKIRGYLEKPTLAFAYIFPILIGIAAISLPVFVNYVLPKYLKGINPAVILLFGTFFISITNMSGYLLIALKRQNTLVAIGFLCVIINVILNLIFVKVFGLGINGIALGTAATYFLYSFFLIGYTIKCYIAGFPEKIKFFANLYGPFLWVLFVFYAFKFLFNYNFNNLKLDVGNLLLETAFFLTLTYPILAIANRKINLYTRIKDAGLIFFKK